ncbi:O-antigen ligase family protein [Salsuginibacillus kocurii]|uniref:O-antigen ligase family protein n=1 Tax=Salsuginibacillus kocurii TaxID=427078 RepID=UPI000370A81D|nr:O-antigen ligase family protein [Salsuginibacillus kocurii]
MIHWMVFILLGGFLLISSYNQGLFLHTSIYAWQLGLAIVFIAYITYLIINTKTKVPYVYLLIFLIPLFYLVSVTNAVTMQGALDQFIQWSLFAMFFFVLVSLKVNQPSIQNGLLLLLQVFGLYIALLPFFVSWEWVEYSDAILGGRERFSSIFQYPNTYAAVTMTLFLFNLIYVSLSKSRVWYIVLISLPLVLYASTLFLSLSRGAMIILPVVWFIGLFFLTFNQQLKYILFTTVGFLGGFAVYMVTIEEWAEFGSAGQLAFLILLSLVAAGLVGSVHRYLSLSINKKTVKYFIPIGSFVVGLALILDFTKEGLIYGTLPSLLQNRISNMGYETLFEDGRVTFFFDAIAMLRDAPLFGWGGEGWSILYHGYQTEPYISNEVHSVVFEQLLNVGVVGSLFMIAIFTYFIGKALQSYLADKNAIVPASFIGLLMLVGHGAIDFDFSFASVWLLFMVLLAIMMPHATTPSLPKIQLHDIRQPGSVILVLMTAAVIVVASTWAFRFEAAERIVQDQTQVSNTQALEAFEEAREYNPYRLSYILNQATIAVEEGDEELTLALSDQFVESRPLSGTAWMNSANSYASFDHFDEAVERYEQALVYDPFNTDIYERLIRLTANRAEELAVEELEEEEVQQRAQQALSSYEKYNETTEEFIENPRSSYKGLEVNQLTHFYAGQSYVLLQDYEQAVSTLGEVGSDDDEVYARANALIIRSLEEKGEEEEAHERLEELREDYETIDQYVEAYQPFFSG